MNRSEFRDTLAGLIPGGDPLNGEFDLRTLPPRPLRGFGNISPITVSERRGFRSR